MKRLRKLEQAVIAALLCCPLAVASAQEVPLIGGTHTANGNVEYTLTPNEINSLDATNGAKVQTAGNLKVLGKENWYSLRAMTKAQITVNGNLDANFGKGNSGGYSGIITFKWQGKHHNLRFDQ